MPCQKIVIQPPSKRRRQLAREQGQAAHSPELTAAAGWLVAVLLLGIWGGDLARGLIALAHGSVSGGPVVGVDPAGFVAQIRGMVLAVAVPLGLILAGFTVGAVAAHQIQVQGLWAPALDRSRPGPALESGPREWAGSRARENCLGRGQGGCPGQCVALGDSRPVDGIPAVERSGNHGSGELGMAWDAPAGEDSRPGHARPGGGRLRAALSAGSRRCSGRLPRNSARISG